MMLKPRPVILLVLLALSVAARLVPYALATLGVPIDPANTIYPWNFSPILPVCLFGGAVYADRRLAYAIPFATFLVGDLGILHRRVTRRKSDPDKRRGAFW